MASILVVDDDGQVRALLRAILEGAGHRVMEAADGAAGLAAFREQPVDLVLCDLSMPSIDGFAVIRELRRTSPGVQVVAMSGVGLCGPTDMLPFAQHLGAAWILPKPFGRTDVLAAVERARQRRARGGDS